MRQTRACFSRGCLSIITHPLFEIISLLVIVTNSVFLAFQDPSAEESTPTEDFFETLFLILYTIEMFFKISALGFIFNRKAYLRDSWNILDFVIVASGIIIIIIFIVIII